MLNRMLANAKLVLAIRDHGRERAAFWRRPIPRSIGLRHSRPKRFHDIQTESWIVDLWRLHDAAARIMSPRRTLGVDRHQQVFQGQVVVRSGLREAAMSSPRLKIWRWRSRHRCSLRSSWVPCCRIWCSDPLGRMSRTIDSDPVRSVRGAHAPPQRESREFADVQSKLNVLGEQFRGAKQDALELRSNIEQLLQRLEEAVLLFDNSGRLLLAGAPAERILGKTQDEMIGRRLEELFPFPSALGGAISDGGSKPASRSRPNRHLGARWRPPQKLLVSVQVLQRRPGGRRDRHPDRSPRRREPEAARTASRSFIAAGGAEPSHRRGGARDQEPAERHGAAAGGAEGQTGRRAARSGGHRAARSSAWTT